MQIKSATLGGGCFWCLDAVFQEVKGVHEVHCGYAGGEEKDADYQRVSLGMTQHAEVVQITYDSELISYAQILDIFWKIHDATTLNRQGNDVGTQYRSVIFYHNQTQKQEAKDSLAKQASISTKPIVTHIEPLDAFYKAEAYHQNYFKNNPHQGYCMAVIAPKVEHFKKWGKNQS